MFSVTSSLEGNGSENTCKVTRLKSQAERKTRRIKIRYDTKGKGFSAKEPVGEIYTIKKLPLHHPMYLWSRIQSP
jgi:hypothetical protein